MTNPDVLPLWLAIPLAIIFWSWLIIALIRDRRARQQFTVMEYFRNPENGVVYPVLKTYVVKNGRWVEKPNKKPLGRRLKHSE